MKEEIHFSVCMGGHSNCHKGEKFRIYRAEGPKIAGIVVCINVDKRQLPRLRFKVGATVHTLHKVRALT